MSSFFRRLFHLFPGEGKEALLFAILGFLWAFSAAAGLKFADALFLIHVGSKSLPIAYTISAALMIVSAAFLIWAFQRFPTNRVFSFALFSSALFYFCIFLFLKRSGDARPHFLWFLLKIFGTIQFSVMVTSFWTFIDDYFHLQDAKRLFSLFNSMIFLGIAATGLIMLLGLIEFEQLSLFISLALMSAIFLIQWIKKKIEPVHDDRYIEGEFSGETSRIVDFFRTILSSKFTLFLMCGNFLTYVLMILTEYNVLSAFNAHFAPTPEMATGEEAEAALTHFMGKALATISISNLFFGLFCYSRLLRSFGIAKLLLLTPILLIATYSGWLATETLLFALMGYFIVEGTFYVIDDANFNIVLNGVPTPLKHKVRILIESFMEPFGTLTSALLISYMAVNPKGLALLLSCLFLLIQLLIGKNYLKAILRNIKGNAIEFAKTTREWSMTLSKKEKREYRQRLLAWLRLPLSPAKQFAADLLLRTHDREALDKIFSESNLFDAKEKKELIQLLSESPFQEDPKVIEKCEEWLQTSVDLDLTYEILWLLAKSGAVHPDKLSDDLDKKELFMRAPAIAALITCQADLGMDEVFRNKKIANDKIEGLLRQEEPLALVWGLKLIQLQSSAADVDIVLPFLSHSVNAVVKEAAITLQKTLDAKAIKYAPRLIAALPQIADSDARLALIDAMAPLIDGPLIPEVIQMGGHLRPQERRRLQAIIERLGLKNIPLLLSLLKETNLNDRSRLISAKIIAALALPQLRSHLKEILKPQVERAAFAFYFRHKKFPEIHEKELLPLREGLLSAYFSAIDFIIELLSLSGELEESELLSQAMRSSNLKVQSQVLEALEKCTEAEVFHLLFPLVDASPLEIKLAHISRLVPTTDLSFKELLEELENSSILSNEILAYYYMKKINHPLWREKIKRKMVEENELFKACAFELLEK